MITATPWWPVLADANSTAPQAPIQRLNNEMLATMTSSASTSFDKCYRVLEPAVEQVFNLDAVLEASIGLSWASMPNSQKKELAAVSRRYSVSSYVPNFDSYYGLEFEVLPTVRPIGNDKVIGQTQWFRTDQSAAKLDYVIRQGRTGWHVVEVLTDGSISRVAMQRSDFRALLASGDESALADGPERNAVSLSGRAV